MNYIARPNLPCGRVTACIVGDKRVGTELEAIGIIAIYVGECADIAYPVRRHADMLFNHIGGDKIVAYHSMREEIDHLRILGFDVHIMSDKLHPKYPLDVALNAARVGQFLICNKAHTYKKINESVEQENIIDVMQGYAKCSTLIVDENSIITADSGIYKAALKRGLYALKIREGGILLDGYDSGFIGGCGVKLSHDLFYFTGELQSHIDANLISEFIESRGIEIICGKCRNLVDIGSIIPILSF